MHRSIMVREILDFLAIEPGMQGLDATLGYGGHTRRMLEALQGTGRIIGLDIDPIESVKTEERLRKAGYGEDVFICHRTNFANIDKVAEEFGKFDFVLADLGVSSMQIDNPERGFSYKQDGPLDLRLNPQIGTPASKRLSELSEDEICGMLVENADEPYAVSLAAAIYKQSHFGKSIDTTTCLKQIIEETGFSYFKRRKRRREESHTEKNLPACFSGHPH